MWLWLWIAVALGGPANAPADLENQWRSLQLLRADPSRYRVVPKPFTVTDGPLSLTIDSGLLVPIFSGHTPNDTRALTRIRLEAWDEQGVVPERGGRGSLEFVGFVWVAGEGSVTVDWNERADHQILANHLVRNLGVDRSTLADVAHGAPWTVGASEAVVLSIDTHIEELFLGPEDVSSDPLEVVVYGEKPRPGALARAKALIKRRKEVLGNHGFDIGEWVAADRVLVARERRTTGAHALIDVHVDQKLGNVHLARDDQPFDGADWLTLHRDETGVTDPRRHTSVSVLDDLPRGPVNWAVTGVPFPPSDASDPRSPPQAPIRMDAEDAYIIVGVHDGGASALVQVMARLKLRAVGGVIDSFDLHIPRAGTIADFEVISVERDDGVSLISDSPLIDHDAALTWRSDDDDAETGPDGGNDAGRPDDPDGVPDPSRDDDPPDELPIDPYHERPESRLTIVPPEPLQPGESIILDVRWDDRWMVSGVTSLDLSTGASIIVDKGASSGRQGVLPRLAGAPNGNPSKFRVRMVTMKRPYLVSAASGTQLSTGEDTEFRIVESGQVGHRVPFVNVAVGGFHTLDQGAEGFPNVRTRMLLSRDGAMMAEEIRRQVRFYEGYMPPYPWEEHEVFESQGLFDSWVWVASHELTSAMRSKATSLEAAARLARADGRHTGQRVVAHEMAHQWWGHLVLPAHTEDFWFCETFAESMAQVYMGAARGSYADAMRDKREEWERFEDLHLPRASLTDAYRSQHQPDIVYRYGPYVFQEMLRKRIGHQAYHAALDLLLRDFAHQSVTTEQIQHYLELASDQDLDAFFDFWVFGGFVPERVEVVWDHADGAVHGVVLSDVPFGRFDVEVALDGDSVQVDVVDGVGRFSVPRESAPASVVLDPGFEILTRKRLSRRGDPSEAVD